MADCKLLLIVIVVRPLWRSVLVIFVPVPRLSRPVEALFVQGGAVDLKVSEDELSPVVALGLDSRLSEVTSFVQILFCDSLSELWFVEPSFDASHHFVSFVATRYDHSESGALRALGKLLDVVDTEVAASYVTHTLRQHRVSLHLAQPTVIRITQLQRARVHVVRPYPMLRSLLLVILGFVGAVLVAQGVLDALVDQHVTHG